MKRTMGLLAALLMVGGLAQAQDGAKLFTKHQCHTCHGAKGEKPLLPAYPKLAGQNATYAMAQMKDIKSGKRNNGMSAAMKAMVQNVPDSDLKAIAKYLESLK